ncbi:MAG: transposase [Candidatus Riflebacteria bacterium]|nr:transposase [Candidatus Riflebacteria bacterium]
MITGRFPGEDGRIISLKDGKISFHYKDYRGKKRKVMTLGVKEFLRKFLQHPLPKRVNKIMYFGINSPGFRKKFRYLQMILWNAAGKPVPIMQKSEKPGVSCPYLWKQNTILTQIFFAPKRDPPDLIKMEIIDMGQINEPEKVG